MFTPPSVQPTPPPPPSTVTTANTIASLTGITAITTTGIERVRSPLLSTGSATHTITGTGTSGRVAGGEGEGRAWMDEEEGSSIGGRIRLDGTLRLRGEEWEGRRSAQRRRVVWAGDVVDNEGLGRKKSKVCCIYHKPREFGESSDKSSSSSDGSSSCDDSDGDEGGGDEGGHGHHGDQGKGKAKGKSHSKSQRKPKGKKLAKNAYERMPKYPGGGSGGNGGGEVVVSV